MLRPLVGRSMKRRHREPTPELTDEERSLTFEDAEGVIDRHRAEVARSAASKGDPMGLAIVARLGERRRQQIAHGRAELVPERR